MGFYFEKDHWPKWLLWCLKRPASLHSCFLILSSKSYSLVAVNADLIWALSVLLDTSAAQLVMVLISPCLKLQYKQLLIYDVFEVLLGNVVFYVGCGTVVSTAFTDNHYLEMDQQKCMKMVWSFHHVSHLKSWHSFLVSKCFVFQILLCMYFCGNFKK